LFVVAKMLIPLDLIKFLVVYLISILFISDVFDASFLYIKNMISLAVVLLIYLDRYYKM